MKQIQALDNKVDAAYPDRIRDDLQIKPEDMETLRKALIAVTEDGQGTAHHAQVKGTTVAGKTGTAQWGPQNKQRTAAWFAGFVPAEHPQYAFAAVYEGDPGDNTVHGGSHAAPLIGKVLQEVYGSKEEKEKAGRSTGSDKDSDKKKDNSDDSKDTDKKPDDQSN